MDHLKCVNCNANLAANDLGCPNVMTTKGTAQGRGTHAAEATTGIRNRYAVNLPDLAEPAKESQKQRWTKATNPMPQGDKTNNGDSGAAMEFDA